MRRFLRLASPVACAILFSLGARAQTKPTVTVWTWQPDAGTAHAMIAAIELAHPNIDLRAVVQPGSVYFAALSQAAAAGTLPDIIALPPGAETQRFRERLKELSHAADSEIGKKWDQQFLPGALADAQLGNPKADDGYYMLPMNMQVDGIWLNVKAFRKAGISAPKTLDDMAADAAKLRKAGITPLVLGEPATQAIPALFFELLARTDAAELHAAVEGRPIWTHPGVIDAANAWHRLFTGGILTAKDLDANPADASSAFREGKAGLMAAGSSWLSQAGTSAVSDYAWLGFPAVVPGRKAPPPVGGVDVGWAITLNGTGTPGEQEAVEAIWRELVVGAGAQQAANALAGVPAFKNVRPHKATNKDEGGLYDKFAAEVVAAKADTIGNPAVADALVAHLRAVAGGSETPAQAMQAVNAVAQKQAMLNG